jgi:hypothetical protein
MTSSAFELFISVSFAGDRLSFKKKHPLVVQRKRPDHDSKPHLTTPAGQSASKTIFQRRARPRDGELRDIAARVLHRHRQWISRSSGKLCKISAQFLRPDDDRKFTRQHIYHRVGDRHVLVESFRKRIVIGSA